MANSHKDMVSRYYALQFAIDKLSANMDQNDEETKTVIDVLKEYKDHPFKFKWDKESIYNACVEYCKRHNRTYLRRKDFRDESLPSIQIIEKYYRMDITDFIKTYFKQPDEYKPYITYTKDQREDLLISFAKEMERTQATSEDEYIKLRDKSLPIPKTIMRLYDIKTWNELKDLAGIKKNYKKRSTIKIESISSLHENKYET